MNADPYEIEFPSRISVTQQEIDTSVLTQEQQTKYLNLFKRVLEIYESKQKARVIVGLAGPTGSGKSVVAALFKQMAGQVDLPFRFETMGIDAFHYPNAYLQTHECSGEQLKEFKGRFDTYDVAKLISVLKDFRAEKAVSYPEYSRKTHDPVENTITINEGNAILLLEGLWLLFDRAGWGHVTQYLDYSFFLDAQKNVVRETVIQRHFRGGRTIEEAASYFDRVDAENYDLVLATRHVADEVIPSYFYL